MFSKGTKKKGYIILAGWWVETLKGDKGGSEWRLSGDHHTDICWAKEITGGEIGSFYKYKSV